MFLKIAVCDDERDTLEQYGERLQRLAEKYNSDAEIILYNSGEELLFKMEDSRLRPDILYLDIRMPHKDGISIAQEIRKIGYPMEVIFLTKLSDKVFDAFDVKAFHYILKEKVSEEKFESIFADAVKRVKDKNVELVNFECAGENCVIPVRDILYFEVMNKIVTVYFRGGQFSFLSSLVRLEERLIDRGFLRVSKSCLINVWRVDKINYGSVTMEDGTVLPVGRTFQQALREIKAG